MVIDYFRCIELNNIVLALKIRFHAEIIYDLCAKKALKTI
jgi:hypothetical protein